MSLLSRLLSRLTGSTATRSIDAGGGGYRWKGAPVLAAPENSLLVARGPARQRASALAMNSAHGARIVEAWVESIVGKGWNVRSQHPDSAIAVALNDEFEAMIMAILLPLVRQLVRDGEGLLRLVVRPDGGLMPQLIPAEQLDASLTRDLGNGARIVAGVEFDAADQVVAYHVMREAPGSTFSMAGIYSEAVRLPAIDVIHVFDRVFPAQVRGVSWLTPVLLKLSDRDATSDAALMALKVQSFFAGFVTDLDGEGVSGALYSPTSGTSSSQTYVSDGETLNPGMMYNLPPGMDIKWSSPSVGFTQAVEFLKLQDREIAAGVGLTYELLTGDLGAANYSSARVGLLQFRRRAEMMQRLLIEAQVLRPLWNRWIDVKLLSGEITSSADVASYRAVRFVPPGWPWVDPKNEVEAEIAAIDAGLKSRAEVVAGRGRDLAELDAEIAADTRPAAQGNAA